MMPLNIKDPETDRLARELRKATGETLTVAVRRALEERLARIRARTGAETSTEDLLEVIRRGRARATLDTRGAEEIIGYDERGLPA